MKYEFTLGGKAVSVSLSKVQFYDAAPSCFAQDMKQEFGVDIHAARSIWEVLTCDAVSETFGPGYIADFCPRTGLWEEFEQEPTIECILQP